MSGEVVYASVVTDPNDQDSSHLPTTTGTCHGIDGYKQDVHPKTLNDHNTLKAIEAVPIPSSSNNTTKCYKIGIVAFTSFVSLVALFFFFDGKLICPKSGGDSGGGKGKTFSSGGGRDWILHQDSTKNTIQCKHAPWLSLGAYPSTPLILVPKGSPDQLLFSQDEMDGLTNNDHDVSFHRLGLQFPEFKDEPKVSDDGKWAYMETSAFRTVDDGNMDDTITMEYVDNNFLLLKSYNDEGLPMSMVLDVSYWKMEEGNTVNFVGGASSSSSDPSSPTFAYGGGRDWILNTDDRTISPKHASHLVLGVGKRRLILVPSNSSHELSLDSQDTEELKRGGSIPFMARANDATVLVTKMYAEEKVYNEWYYIESEVRVEYEEYDDDDDMKAMKVKIQYVDDNYFLIEGDDNNGKSLVLDVSLWVMEASNSVNFVRGDDEQK